MTCQEKWRKRSYSHGVVREFCHRCDWHAESREAVDDLGHCPACGGITGSMVIFGGLVVEYNRTRENFTLATPGRGWESVCVDNADVPDTIQFMLRRFPFGKWWRGRS